MDAVDNTCRQLKCRLPALAAISTTPEASMAEAATTAPATVSDSDSCGSDDSSNHDKWNAAPTTSATPHAHG